MGLCRSAQCVRPDAATWIDSSRPGHTRGLVVVRRDQRVVSRASRTTLARMSDAHLHPTSVCETTSVRTQGGVARPGRNVREVGDPQLVHATDIELTHRTDHPVGTDVMAAASSGHRRPLGALHQNSRSTAGEAAGGGERIVALRPHRRRTGQGGVGRRMTGSRSP